MSNVPNDAPVWLNLEGAVPTELRDQIKAALDAIEEVDKQYQSVCKKAHEALTAYRDHVDGLVGLPEDLPYEGGALGDASGYSALRAALRRLELAAGPDGE